MHIYVVKYVFFFFTVEIIMLEKHQFHRILICIN